MINNDCVITLKNCEKKRDVTDIERCRRNIIFRVYTIHVTVESNVSLYKKNCFGIFQRQQFNKNFT